MAARHGGKNPAQAAFCDSKLDGDHTKGVEHGADQDEDDADGGHVFDDRLKEPLALKGAGELDLSLMQLRRTP